jgi:hypothetical protein
MEKLYWTMVGKYFPQSEEIQLLCSEIDQRLALDLPSFTLRERLEEKMYDYMEASIPIRNPKQRKAVNAVFRDLAKYTYEQEKPFTVDFTLRDGTRFTYNLNDETLQDHSEQERKIRSAEFRRRGLMNKALVIKWEDGETQRIHPEDIANWENSAVLHTLFLLSKQDRKIVLQHMAQTNQALAGKSLELEELRNRLAVQIGRQLQLVHEDIIQASQALDDKIIEFMRIQHHEH